MVTDPATALGLTRRFETADARSELAMLAWSASLPLLVPAVALLSAYVAWQLARASAPAVPPPARAIQREQAAPSLN